MPRQDKVFVCFQKAEDDTHKLYIYDDVTAYGTFNWSTWSYEESETSAKYFQEQLATIPDTLPFLNNVTINPAGPTANTVPTITSKTTLKILITFFMNPPR